MARAAQDEVVRLLVKRQPAAQLVATLASLAHTTGNELSEADRWRILDALLLIATHPAGP